jgi:hypothetical protein
VRRWLTGWLPLAVALVLASMHGAIAATVTARFDRDTVVVGDTAVLEVQVQNGNPTALPVFAAQPNLSIEAAGNGRSISIANGQRTDIFTMSYNVISSQPGTYTIAPTRVQTDAGVLMTPQLTLTVTRDENASATGSGPAFIHLQVSKTNVYVGEMIPIDIKVYGLMIDELQVPVLKSEGFVIGTQAQAVRGREQVGNNIYHVYSFPISISAAKAGSLTLGPAEAAMVIRIPNQRRGGDPFDGLFGGSFQRKQMTGRSETVAMNVMPLPAQNRPASFNGAVGSFEIKASASPTNVAVGDPITLRIEVQGRGSFDSVKLPDFGWKDFTFYQPTASVTNSDNLGTRAVKYFDQVIIPQRAGIAAIPPLTFSFFDPDARAYKTVTKPAIPITVRDTGHGQAQPTVIATTGSQGQQQGPATDIVHIKPTLGHLSFLGPPFAARPWFMIMLLLPVGLWGMAVAWRRQTDRFANDPRIRREREVAKTIAELLPKLREHAARRESDQFFATTFRLLQERLGEVLDLPAAAITEAVVDEILPKLGADADLVKKLEGLFQACNQARYAGATIADMEALIPQIESALQQTLDLKHAKDRK